MSWRGRSPPARARRSELRRLDGAIVSTVVPQLGPEYERSPSGTWAGCLLVGPSLKTGMPILDENPHEVGADRIVNAVAAHAKYGARGGRFRYLDQLRRVRWGRVPRRGDRPRGRDLDEGPDRARGEAPRSSWRARGGVGKHTTAAIQSGFIFGYAGLVDGIDRRIAESRGEKTFIATGGLGRRSRRSGKRSKRWMSS